MVNKLVSFNVSRNFVLRTVVFMILVGTDTNN